MTDTVVQPTLDELQLPVAKIHPNPGNVRSELGDLTELADSIRSIGVVEPVLVHPHPELEGEWMLIAGHRRHAAAQIAGRETVPAVVRDTPDEVTLAEIMLAENTHRSGLDPIDEAQALLRLKTSGKYRSVKEIAGRVHRSEVWVAERLRLLTLPESTWPSIREGQVTIGDALEVAKINTGPEAKETLLRHAANGNRRALQAAVEEQRQIERRRELEREYGPLRPRSELWRFTQDAPWGVVRIGDGPGELDIPVAMHRGCDGHAAFERPEASKLPPDVYCATPLEHAADFPASVEWPHRPPKAKPLSELGLGWREARAAHAAVCEHHRELDFPWKTVAVCVDPTIHTNEKRKGYLPVAAMIEKHRGQGAAAPSVPRWEVDAATRGLLRARLVEQLEQLDPVVVQVLAQGNDFAAYADVTEPVDVFVESTAAWLCNADWLPHHLDETDARFADGLLWALQACIDAGNPPPNLDEIRTRLDVLTKGDAGQTTDEEEPTE